MRKTDRRTPLLLAAAAFAASALLPAFAAAQATDEKAVAARPAAGRTELGLTPDQVKALEAFRKARQDERRAFRDEAAKLRGEMRELRRDPQADRARIEALIDKRAGLRAEREKSALRARAERDKIFTPEQLQKLRSLRERRIARPGRADRARLGRGPGGGLVGPRLALRRAARLGALRHRPLARAWRRYRHVTD